MERYPKQIHVRMSEGEIAHAKALASKLDMTLSDLIRCLLQMPAGAINDGTALVVIVRATAAKFSREMRRWGHHYNQAVHALNAIAYYLRANDMDADEVIGGAGPNVLEARGHAAGHRRAARGGRGHRIPRHSRHRSVTQPCRCSSP